MTNNLPPLPPYAPEFKPRWPNDPEGYTADQMHAYAIAAIAKDRERQSAPSGWYVTNATKSTVKHWPITEDQAIALAAAPQPQPVQPEGPMAETVEQAARDVAKCLNERDGQGLDLRHVAMLVHYAQQPVQEQCPECDGTGTVSGSQAHFLCPLCTSPQAQPLSADASPISVLLAVEESIKNGGCPWQIEQAFDEYEAQRQSEITKGTT